MTRDERLLAELTRETDDATARAARDFGALIAAELGDDEQESTR